ncbi:hypothetical protein CLOSTASPAR_05388 [[Clostridium] asparagiforme DSM 15981]|uniref:Uncharacterized protein n=1 Tax=[Clostridium] asparagiforme DSM 15981 TaxID=518636 RepID=C0D7Z0_9FIRM|nr:hypothetical protein CLOSTASPAR_05388 [[Clostridium] asparagiforme DSM 15981]
MSALIYTFIFVSFMGLCEARRKRCSGRAWQEARLMIFCRRRDNP